MLLLPDGSYVVHVVTSSGEQHVHVSAGFAVTGAGEGGGPGGVPPSGAPPSAPGATTSS